LGFLQSIASDKKIGKCYLAAAFTNDLGWQELNKLFDPPLDYTKIKDKAEKLIFIHGNEDPHCPVADTVEMAKNLRAEMHVLPGKQHLSVSTDGEEFRMFPFLLDLILT
jgi:hypothetical protein